MNLQKMKENELCRPTWLEIDLAALVANLRQIRSRIGAHCLLAAVVKANAYGHGAVAVARSLAAAGADRFAVATLGEALELRSGGVGAPILVLGYTPPWLASLVVANDITITVYDLETVLSLAQAAAEQKRRATVHVKVNTGMNRLGLRAGETPGFMARLEGMPVVEVEGILTHFATADTDRAFAARQFADFRQLLSNLEREGLRPPIAHAANSAATLTMPETHLDMVRCGIALYGLHPDDVGCRLPAGFRPVLSWKAQVVHVIELDASESVSYGREFVADRSMVVATIPVGYADGFPRKPLTWGSVLIQGRPAPILGRVCMDQTVVDVTAIVQDGGQVRVGDEAVLIGEQENASLRAEEVARRIGTINYDVVSRILPRVPRVLIGVDANGEPDRNSAEGMQG